MITFLKVNEMENHNQVAEQVFQAYQNARESIGKLNILKGFEKVDEAMIIAGENIKVSSDRLQGILRKINEAKIG